VLSKSSQNVFNKKKKWGGGGEAGTLEVLIATIPLKGSPLGSVHNDANIFAMIGRCPGSPFVSNVSSTFCNSACISNMVSNLHPLNLILILGKRKKSQRAKSGE